MIRPLLLVPAVLVLALGAVAAGAGRRWLADTERWRERLAGGGMPSTSEVGKGAEVRGTGNELPAPVVRFLDAALGHDRSPPARVRIRWRGEFNLGAPGADRWLPFTATQDFVPAAPGFVWDARIRMAPGLTTYVRDSLVGTDAAMLARVMALATVADARGTPGLAEGALQRYLGEAAWFPAALLPAAGVRWEPIDDTRARATITAHGRADAAGASPGLPVSLEFRFGPEGLPASVYTPARLFDDGRDPPVLRPWQARYLRYGRVDGRLVPTEAVVEWLLPGGAWAVWRGRPESIEALPLMPSRAGNRG